MFWKDEVSYCRPGQGASSIQLGLILTMNLQNAVLLGNSRRASYLWFFRGEERCALIGHMLLDLWSLAFAIYEHADSMERLNVGHPATSVWLKTPPPPSTTEKAQRFGKVTKDQVVLKCPKCFLVSPLAFLPHWIIWGYSLLSAAFWMTYIPTQTNGVDSDSLSV